MWNKKCIFCLIAILTLVVYLIFIKLDEYRQNNNRTQQSAVDVVNTGVNTAQTSSTKNVWLYYSDSTYHFHLAYPENLRVMPLDKEDGSGDNSPDGGVSFATLGPGTMGVKIYKDTSFKTVNEWLAYKNINRMTLQKEKIIRIDGYDAIITHLVTPAEEFPNEKKIALLKDGYLYEIWTKFYDNPSAYKIVLDSFGFNSNEEKR